MEQHTNNNLTIIKSFVGFTDEQIETIDMLCKSHFTIAEMASAIGVETELMTSNLSLMEHIRDTKMIEEIAFWESIKASALNGDKNMLTLYLARISEAKTNLYE